MEHTDRDATARVPGAARPAPACARCIRLRLLVVVLVAMLCFGVGGPSSRLADAASPAAASAPPSALNALKGLLPAITGVASAVAPNLSLPPAAASAATALKGVASAVSAVQAAAASATGSAVPVSGTVTLPVAAQTPASATALPDCAAAGASATACTPPTASLQWLHSSVALPPAQLEQPYGPTRLVEGGRGAYSFTVLEGRLPPGLAISPDGALAGSPTLVGSYPFMLAVRDASTPPQTTQQRYTLRVQVPRGTTAARPKAPAAPASTPTPTPTLSRVPVTDATMLVSEAQAVTIRTYQLTADNLNEIAPFQAAPAASASAAASAPDPTVSTPVTPPAADATPAPLVEQLHEMLARLVGVEYPSRELFEAALANAHCSYFKVLAGAAARKQGITGPPPECPTSAAKAPAAAGAAAPKSAAKAASSAAGDGLTLRQFYVQLLPEDLAQDIVAIAEKPHLLSDAKPTQWYGMAETAGLTGSECGCAPAAALGETYGFYPFWRASGKPQPMDFSLFRRIAYLGVVPDDAGGYTQPTGWDNASAGFARTAQRYGTAVDLVLYRRDWSSLLQLPAAQQQAAMLKAAANAVKLVDTQPTDLTSRLNHLLLPGWREPSRLYGGITVYFDDAASGASGQAAFRSLYSGFMKQLITEMQHTGRNYVLNLVVPEHRLGEPGAFSFEDLMGYLDLAEPTTLDTAKSVNEVSYKDNLPIQVRFVVPLAEPTSDHKKSVRERVDRSDFVKGHRRNELLKSIVPILFYPALGDPVALSQDHSDRIDADLQYFWWNFGNAAFWPTPTPDTGAGGDVGKVLAHAFSLHGDGTLDGLCRFVCPNRVPLRLLLQTLVLVSAVATGLYLWVCRLRSLGRLYLAGLLAAFAATLVVAALLLSCDPALEGARSGNGLFYALIALLFAGGAYALLRPRVDKP